MDIISELEYIVKFLKVRLNMLRYEPVGTVENREIVRKYLMDRLSDAEYGLNNAKQFMAKDLTNV